LLKRFFQIRYGQNIEKRKHWKRICE
jgi:hypothetical protein